MDGLPVLPGLEKSPELKCPGLFVTTMILYGDDPLAFYLRELDTIPPLSKGEETVLLQHVRSNDELSESSARRLIEANLSLVVSIAEHHRSSGTPMLDLVQEGNGGLLLALQDT